MYCQEVQEMLTINKKKVKMLLNVCYLNCRPSFAVNNNYSCIVEKKYLKLSGSLAI